MKRWEKNQLALEANKQAAQNAPIRKPRPKGPPHDPKIYQPWAGMFPNRKI